MICRRAAYCQCRTRGIFSALQRLPRTAPCSRDCLTCARLASAVPRTNHAACMHKAMRSVTAPRRMMLQTRRKPAKNIAGNSPNPRNGFAGNMVATGIRSTLATGSKALHGLSTAGWTDPRENPYVCDTLAGFQSGQPPLARSVQGKSNPSQPRANSSPP